MSRPLDPITLQVLSAALRSVCEEMGAALVRAAYSANIKERRDCSTALFDARGRLVAQAEHIPVHLGAMPDAVRAVIARNPVPGDIFILNDPFSGGTHLPDITMVSTVDIKGVIIAYAASRAHHADVGGLEPGSMPADSRSLKDEGVVIPPTRLVAAGRQNDEFLNDLLSQMRRPSERRGDLRAQMGAAIIAAHRLGALVDQWGLDTLQASMNEAVAYSERRMRAAIRALPQGTWHAVDFMERGESDLKIAVTVTVAGEEIYIDFAGTDPQEQGNLNSPMPVTRSACYYVVRSVTDPDIPPNAGAMAPVTIEAPAGCLVNAEPPAAVVGGNVEASQRIADALMLAFSQAIDLPAQGQGTMNNVILGNDDFNYYETIGGGAGGCPGHDGASGIHQGTTNTLNTPIEALEMAFPLRVERYELREGSGGGGRHRGGDGVVRSLRLLTPARVSLLCERRRHGPRGAAGGDPGLPGRNLINDTEVSSKVTIAADSGDLVTIETPGGGGYGKALKTGRNRRPGGMADTGVEKSMMHQLYAYLKEKNLKSLSLQVFLFLIFIDIVLQVLAYVTINHKIAFLNRMFHLDMEMNISSIYSSAQLIFVGLVVYACMPVDKKTRVGRIQVSYVWLAIGTILVLMGLDELFSVHEGADAVLYDLKILEPGQSPLQDFGWLWTLVAAPLALVVGAMAAVYTYRIFSRYRHLFYMLLLAGVVFVSGAILVENFGVYFWKSTGEVSYTIIMIEEFMEMAAVSLAAFVFLRYLGERLQAPD